MWACDDMSERLELVVSLENRNFAGRNRGAIHPVSALRVSDVLLISKRHRRLRSE